MYFSMYFTMYFLVESQNIKRQNTMQAKAADENLERITQEIIRRERECKTFKEDIQREKTRTRKQLREMQETVYDLEHRLNLTENENKKLFEKLKNNEVDVENLKMLNKRKEEEMNEKVGIIEKLKDEVTNYEMKL